MRRGPAHRSLGVDDLVDRGVRGLRGLLDRLLAGADLLQHGLEGLGLLDLTPARCHRHEPVGLGGGGRDHRLRVVLQGRQVRLVVGQVALGEQPLLALGAGEGVDPLGRDVLRLGLDRDGEVGAAEEDGQWLAGRAGHHEVLELVGEFADLVVLRVGGGATLPGGAEDRRGLALAEDDRTVGLVLGLVAVHVLVEDRLVLIEALEGLGRGEVGLPLVAVLLGDGATGVVDEGHRGVPVRRRLVPGAELVALLLLDLVQGGGEFGVRLGGGLDVDLGGDVLAPGAHAATGVVGDTVGLALVLGGLLEAVQPRVRLIELLRVDLGEGALHHVAEHLGVAHLDNVRRLVGGEHRVKLGVLVRPAVVLVLDLDAGVLLDDRVVGRLHQFGPVVLRVDGEPDGQFLGVTAGLVPALVRITTGRKADHHARDAYRRDELALHATLLRDACNPCPPQRHTTSTTRGAGTWPLMV